MKSKMKLIAVLAIAVLLVGVAAGCTSTSTNTNTNSGSDEKVSPSPDNEEALETVAEVVSVSGSELEVRFYAADSDGDEIGDYAAIDLSGYTATEETSILIVADDAEIFAVSSGELAEAVLEDVTEGAYLAVTYAGSEAQKLVILDIGQPAMLVAEVTGISEDGLLSLTRYEFNGDTSEENSIDYANVDLGSYQAAEDTDEYTVTDDILVSVAEDGVLTETTADEIAVGDMLVFYLTEDGQTAIAVYHQQSTPDTV